MTNESIEKFDSKESVRDLPETKVVFDDPEIQKSLVLGIFPGNISVKTEVESLVKNPTIQDSIHLLSFFKNLTNKKDDLLEDVIDKLIFGRIENCLLKNESKNVDLLSAYLEDLINILNNSDIDEVIKGKILKSLGYIQHNESKSYRAFVISEQLGSKSLYVRHASVVGLSSLMDGRYLNNLESAFNVEKDTRLKKFIEKVIGEIRESTSAKN